MQRRDGTKPQNATMEDECDPGDVFAIPDLYQPSNLIYDAAGYSSSLFSHLKLAGKYIDESLPNIVNHNQHDHVFFSIPDISFGPSDQLLTPNESTVPRNDDTDVGQSLDEHKQSDVDIWLNPRENLPENAFHYSWDGFEGQKLEEYRTPYATEAGSSVFDTIIVAEEGHLNLGDVDYLVVDARAYTVALLYLGLGRNSVFFTWDEHKRSFAPALPKTRMSGYSGNSLDSLVVTFMECGDVTKHLQAFVDQAYSRTTSSGRVALADAVSTLLTTIRSNLSSLAAEHHSVLQLEAIFKPAHTILTCFKRIVVNVSATRSDESMLSTIFEEIQLLEHRTDTLREILLQILRRVSQPWLEFVEGWLGTGKENGLALTKEGMGKSFVKVERKEWIDEQGLEMREPDYLLDYDKVPAFVAPEDARAIFEAGKSLRFLRDHHADHPLARQHIIESANPPLLQWSFSWQDIMQVEAKALQYEKDLVGAIQKYSDHPSAVKLAIHERTSNELDFDFEFLGKPEEDMQAHVLASIDLFNSIPATNTLPDPLTQGLGKYLTSRSLSDDSESIFAPPISLVPVLSFNPIIAAQARVINGTCMRIFFNSHNLREHLTLQRSFHLLGNGVFSSRLAHALFDPDLETAERHRGVARSGGIMGLRLGGRDNWPPAGSELRLALMGILTESYSSTQTLNKSYTRSNQEQASLPGDLSFAVRDMTEAEIEKCMNPDSVEALDFLRLTYKPPPPLEAVITPIILFKYDQLFKLLLRLIRTLYVVNALFRDGSDREFYERGNETTTQRFRIEAHHFISSLAGYFFDTGIEATWRIFDRKLDQIEQRISTDDDNITLGQNEGIDKLRDYHERVLDRIMFALFLRKRQAPVLNLLEEIFTIILKFAKHSRARALGLKKQIGEDDEIKEVYSKFRKKIGVFITVCKGLSDKKGYGEKKGSDNRKTDQESLFDGDDLAEENTVSQLLTRLEMSNYYSRPVNI